MLTFCSLNRFCRTLAIGILLASGAIQSVSAADPVTTKRDYNFPVNTPGLISFSLNGRINLKGTADENSPPETNKTGPKISFTAGPPPAFTNQTLNDASTVVSNRVPGTQAVQSASLAASGTTLAGGNLHTTITKTTSAEVQLGVPPPGQGTGGVSRARARDPLIVGTSGLGGQPIPQGSIFSMNFALQGVSHLAPGSSWSASNYIVPGAIADPDAFAAGLTGLTNLFALTADSTGFHFTPGTSNSNFAISFSNTTAQIESGLLSYFNGGGDQSLFSVNVMTLAAFDNITLGSEDLSTAARSVAAVPEPDTYAMMLAGLGLVAFVGARRRKSRQA